MKIALAVALVALSGCVNSVGRFIVIGQRNDGAAILLLDTATGDLVEQMIPTTEPPPSADEPAVIPEHKPEI